MVTYKEFSIEWNNVMQLKIKESDLRIPNETILTNILLHYLEQFGFAINLLRERQSSENHSVRHNFKVNLCSYINHLYKLGNETSQPFTYFDLVNPTPKKTYHVLKYLLNYLLFFNMMKVDVIDPTINKINEYKEIYNKIQTKKLEEKNNEQLRTKYHKEIPKISDQIEHLISVQNKQSRTIEQLQTKLNETESRLANLRDQKLHLCSKIVTNEEADSIERKKIVIEKELEEQSEIEHAVMDRNRQTKITLNKLEEFLKYGDNIMEVYSLKVFEKHCTIAKKQTDLYSMENFLENKNDQAKMLIEQNVIQINNKKAALQQEMETFKNIEIQASKKIKELEENIEKEEKQNELIDFELHKIENALIAEQNNENTIENAKKFLLEPLKSKSMFDFNISEDKNT
ncbi:putative leucine-rich repeat-containing protein DDB_G0290503 [Condylostylus longicornis]|uniref:putative leucine-rich repeat-containing protein DDB_G0290503 n=1 Tax=Condylostylus longicornis TaxID=2530218 RepID=UPI00244DDDD3|nr:putative leucine-rich repeat-containing protein DDB_G0290503 [Condylostylus longicornis]